MKFAVGSLVSARGREWVVLPDSGEDLLVLRPLGGTDEEIAGILLALEDVQPAQFDPPDPTSVGDHRSARLLRDALRLGFRSSAGPFRSFGRLGFEPRPYQLVPMLMALKLDPVRILIADDVGIGKTIEAGLIARELLDRGEVRQLSVLCPPPLAEQWQAELRDKFHIDAVLVLPGTARRLERGTSMGQSLFEVHPFTVVSTDFIKSVRRRDEFLRTCPNLVIVDEAHTCAFAAGVHRGRHQRHELVSRLAQAPNRHLLLVTATPHSGKEEAFRSLLSFLDPDFAQLPEDLAGEANAAHRRRLAAHFVQRRRADIRHFMQEATPFPERETTEISYRLSRDYARLFDRVLAHARESVLDESGEAYRRRVRWWSALALLRSLASSPAAAAATLRARARVAGAEDVEDLEEIGRRSVLDLVEDETTEGIDVVPGGDIGELADDEAKNRRRLSEMAKQADGLRGAEDQKLQQAIPLVRSLLDDGFSPILFCRFIPTADYLAGQLREALGKGVEVASVTGLLPPEEREQRVRELGEMPKRVLVCTDCLSEGINLQQHFNAVLHYDLSWNPTRHEQREGRVDRFGQPRKLVRTLTYYGIDNRIDGIVIDVLLRKHEKIRNSLGISVPVPGDVEQVVEALFEGLLLREKTPDAPYLPGFEEFIRPKKEELYQAWDAAEAREKRSRTMFAQEGIKADEVAEVLGLAREAVGSGVDVARFMYEAVTAGGGMVSRRNGLYEFDLREMTRAARDRMGIEQAPLKARFEATVQPGEVSLTRTHPIVEGLASHVLDAALDPIESGHARRCGAIRTRSVSRRTTLLLLRHRYHIIHYVDGSEVPLLAEDSQLAAFTGPAIGPEWLTAEETERLLGAEPAANITPEQAAEFVREVIDESHHLRATLNSIATQRADVLLEAHLQVRRSAKLPGRRPHIETKPPPDILGIYVYLPTPGAA